MVCAGTDGCTAIDVALTQRIVIGSKLAGSYGSFGLVMALSTIVLVLPRNSVWPSGAERTTSIAPIVPPPPPWFST